MGSAPRLLGCLGRDGASSVLEGPHPAVSARLTVGVLARARVRLWLCAREPARVRVRGCV